MAARTSFVFDTYDAALSGEPSVVEVLGRTHRRALQWDSFRQGVLGPGFASTWEQASPTSLLLTIREDSWPAGPGLDARVASADDLVEHLNRVVALAAGDSLPLSQMPWAYGSIERVEALDDRSVRIDTSSPDAFLVETLASRFAAVQRTEAVESYGDELADLHPEQVVGTGDFLYQGFVDGALSFVARSGGDALLDALTVAPAGASADAFIAGDGDEFLARDRREAPAVRDALGSLVRETRTYEDSPVVASFAVGAPPWNDSNLLAGVSGALNRGWLIDTLFANRAAPSGIVAPASSEPFLPSAAILASWPGYRADSEADASDARARWEAAGGAALGPIMVDVPAIFDPLYSAAASISARLKVVLGADVQPAIVSYTDIAERLANGYYGNGRAAFWFGWSSPLESPDPSRWLLNQFHSASASAVNIGLRGCRDRSASRPPRIRIPGRRAGSHGRRGR